MAVITVTPGSYSKELGQFWVEVDACSSTDDGLLLRAEITKDPGTYWQQFGAFRYGTWLNAGEHRFQATVWDDEGLQASAIRTITLDEAPPNIQVSWKVEGLTIYADASGSTDQSGPITRFSWEWGDGTVDGDLAPNGDPLPPQPIITHTYPEPGTYDIRLVVRAPDGQWAIHNETVLIGSAIPTESHDVPAIAPLIIVIALICAARTCVRK